jgi:lysophospholipase L1-like esterase
MQAMNGSASPFRSRGRLIGCCMALALALSALVFAPVASAKVTPPVETVLSLGDSLAFGYSQEVFEENFPNDAPAFFEKGYTDEVKLKLKKEHKGIVLVNTGCPGDTSNGLVGENTELGGAKDAAHFPCPYHNLSGLPLHHSLPGVHSGLEDVMSILNKGKPAHPVVALTLNIGGNDELASISACEKQVKVELETKGYTEENPTKTHTNTPEGIHEAIFFCVINSHEATFKTIEKNIENVVKDVTFGGGYKGPILLLGNYNPQSFALPGSDGLQEVLNAQEEALVKEMNTNFGTNVKFYNPFPVFNPSPEGGTKEKKALEKYTEYFNAKDIAANKAKKEAANKKEEEEGALVTFPSSGAEGDIHPSPAGYKKLGLELYKLLP